MGKADCTAKRNVSSHVPGAPGCKASDHMGNAVCIVYAVNRVNVPCRAPSQVEQHADAISTFLVSCAVRLHTLMQAMILDHTYTYTIDPLLTRTYVLKVQDAISTFLVSCAVRMQLYNASITLDHAYTYRAIIGVVRAYVLEVQVAIDPSLTCACTYVLEV